MLCAEDVMEMFKSVAEYLSLCILSVLCASVVSVSLGKPTTEARSTRRSKEEAIDAVGVS
jgi:hypothetical protein